MVNIHCQPPSLMRIYSKLMHILPIMSGLTQLSFNSLTNSQFAKCNGLIVASLLNGVRIKVEPNEYSGRILYLFGTNDPKVHVTAQALLRPGDQFLDIGANYSSIGLLAADKVGPKGKIHLFEPQSQLCQRIETAIEQAGISNVELHSVALMDRDGEMKIMRPSEQHSGRATLIENVFPNQNEWKVSEIVTVRNIATYVPSLIGEKPFGAKVDVEGAEPYIIPWLLKQPNLRFLIFEAEHNLQQLWDLIQVLDLKLYGLVRLVFKKQIQLVESFEQMSLYHDLVAIRLPDGFKPPKQINPYKLGQMIEQHNGMSVPPAQSRLS